MRNYWELDKRYRAYMLLYSEFKYATKRSHFLLTITKCFKHFVKNENTVVGVDDFSKLKTLVRFCQRVPKKAPTIILFTKLF